MEKQSIFYPLKLMFVLRKTKAVNNLKQGSIWLLTYDQDIHLHFNTFGTLTCTQIVFAFYFLRSQFSKSSYFVRIHKMKNTPQKRYPEMPAEIFFFCRTFSGSHPPGYFSSFGKRLISFLQKSLSLSIFRKEFHKY